MAMKLITKVLIGAGVLGAGTLILWPSISKAAGGGAPKDKKLDPPVTSHPEDYANGLVEGKTHGLADGSSGFEKAPRPSTYSTDPKRQADFEKGYMFAYDSSYDSAKALKSFTTDTTSEDTKTDVEAGKKKVGTYDDATRGRNMGRSDAYPVGFADGQAGRPPNPTYGFPMMPNGSDAYKAGWREGIADGYTRGYAAGQSASTSGVRGNRVGQGFPPAPQSNFGWPYSYYPTGMPVGYRAAQANYSEINNREECYNWGLKRGQSDKNAGNPFDNKIVAHSDIGRDGIIQGWSSDEIAACAANVLLGYQDGYGSMSPYAQLYSYQPTGLGFAAITNPPIAAVTGLVNKVAGVLFGSRGY